MRNVYTILKKQDEERYHPKTENLLYQNQLSRLSQILKVTNPYIYIFIAIALDESIFLDVLHFPMKNIKSRGLEATPMGGLTSELIQ